MHTWAFVTFLILTAGTAHRILNVGFSEDYPREISRQEDSLVLLIRVAWVIWGVWVIF